MNSRNKQASADHVKRIVITTSSFYYRKERIIPFLKSTVRFHLGTVIMIGNDETRVESLETSLEYDDHSTSVKQEAQTFLRERFLRVITGVIGKHASFYMHENTKVKAEFRGCDVDCSEIFARNLETPLGKVPEAILRGTDVICIEIDGIKTEP